MSLPDFVGSVQTLPESLVLAIDTEFADTHTLSVQVAARLSPDTVVIQVYRSAAIPDPPPDFDAHQYLPTVPDRYGRFFQRIIKRPVQPLTPQLSPISMVRDLLNLRELRLFGRADGEQLLQAFELYFP